MSATCGVEITGGRFTDLARRVRGVIADDNLAAGVDDAGRLVTEALRPHRGNRIKGALPDDLARRPHRGPGPGGAGPRRRPQRAQRRARGDAGPGPAGGPVVRLPAGGPPRRGARHRRPGDVGGGHGQQPDAAGRPARRGRPPPADAVGQAHHRAHQRHPPRPAARAGSGWRPRRSPSSMSAARSTTRPTPSSTAPPTCPTRATPATSRRSPTSSATSSRRPAGAPWRCSPASGCSTRRPPPCSSASTCRSSPSATCPRPACSSSSPPTRPPACSPPWASGRASTCPGASLSLVAIDRIPFPRPDEPLLQARRERAGPEAFGLIDLPRAATLLAQGAGRLIRTADDHGVVAVLDPRLAKAGYRWDMIQALPPMRRTKDPAEARRALEAIRDSGS